MHILELSHLFVYNSAEVSVLSSQKHAVVQVECNRLLLAESAKKGPAVAHTPCLSERRPRWGGHFS